MKGDNAEEFLRRTEPEFKILTTPTFNDALHALSQGQYDAVVCQRLVALRLIQETGITNLKVVNTPIDGFRQDFCFAVKEGDRDTLALLNEGLSLVMADGTFRYLHAKWFAAMELETDNRIVVGGDHAFPPFEYLDIRGQPAGFNVELTQAIARELGLDVEIRLGPWEEMRSQFELGEIDALQGLLYSPQRDLTCDFSAPHTILEYVSTVRVGDGPPPATLEELAGWRVSVQGGDILHDYLVEQGLEGQATVVESQEAVLRELIEGRADCALVVRLPAHYYIRKNGWTQLEVSQTPLLTADYCYACRENNKSLLALFTEGLKVIDETGEYRRIQEKWLGVTPAPPSLPEIMWYSARIVIPVLVVLLLFILWSWSLRREVARRTAELRRSENRLRKVFEILPVGLWFADQRGILQAGNPAGVQIWGADPQVAPSAYGPFKARRTASEAASPQEDWALERTLRDGVTVLDEELEIDTFDGRQRTILNYSAPILDDQGAIDGVVLVNVDITDRKQAEEALRQSQRRISLNSSIAQVFLTSTPENLYGDALHVVLDALGAKFGFFGYIDDKGDLVCPSLTHGIWEDSPASAEIVVFPHDQWGGLWGQALRERRPLMANQNLHTPQGHVALDNALVAPIVHQDLLIGLFAVANKPAGFDDTDMEMLVHAAAQTAPILHGLLERARNEDARRALEEQYRQAQKMEAIGQLTGGVAHDFNNLLQVINGGTDMALEDLEPGNPAREALLDVSKAGERAARLVQQLLLFSRRQIMRPEILDLNTAVNELLKMVRRVIAEHIHLEWLPAQQVIMVNADRGMIEQALMNLCLNARDAMPEGGTLTIRTDLAVFDEAACRAHSWASPGEYAGLHVSDTGSGMNEEVREHIFEPFFTTKEQGKGTGLGLATVFGIVKQHEGFIRVEGSPGEGTGFSLYFPRCAQPVEPAVHSAPSKLASGSETILLAEDDAMVRNLARAILERAGYTVLAASDGSKAVDLFEKQGDQIDLVLLDVVMPVMGGRAALDRIRALRRNARVIFASGYSEKDLHTNFVLDSGLVLIQKPYTREDLLQAVREALDAEEAR